MKIRKRPLGRLSIDAEMKTDSTGDVAFLLVIFFMLTATFAATRGIEFGLPDPSPIDGGDGRESVLISVGPDGTLLVDCEPMAASEIVGYLAPRLSRNPNKPVIVHPHEEAPYSSLVAVLDELAAAPDRGFSVDNVQISTPQIVAEYREYFGRNPLDEHCL